MRQNAKDEEHSIEPRSMQAPLRGNLSNGKRIKNNEDIHIYSERKRTKKILPHPRSHPHTLAHAHHSKKRWCSFFISFFSFFCFFSQVLYALLQSRLFLLINRNNFYSHCEKTPPSHLLRSRCNLWFDKNIKQSHLSFESGFFSWFTAFLH